ncbi:MAG: hypothetical protein KAS32_10690 [Candidatus Peribacteraceae bacterium]|nr:hypothetical protein [Candidatus Peribacteraceae bacterium]
MIKCTVCGKEMNGRGKTCSSKCRKILSRSVTESVTTVTQSVTKPTVTKCDRVSVTSWTVTGHEAGLQHYLNHPDMYYPRKEPDKLNWGPHMTATQLHNSKFKANRVAIPGDYDYAGKSYAV